MKKTQVKPDKKLAATHIKIGCISICMVTLAALVYAYWPQPDSTSDTTIVQPNQASLATPKLNLSQPPINTAAPEQQPITTYATPSLSKTAFSVELAQYALNVQYHSDSAVSWLQQAVETAAKQETQESLLTAVEHIRQQNTSMNIERLLLQFHSLSEHIQFAFIDTNIENTKSPPVLQQSPVSSDFSLWGHAERFLQSNLLVTRQTQKQNSAFLMKLINQQQNVRALLRQAELALSLRYNGYFHTVIQNIQQALPNVVASNQTDNLSEQLSHFNQYNISYQPYSLAHLLSLDLSDKATTNNAHIQPENNTLHHKKRSEQDSIHTALLQPKTPTITEAF